jgi:hypothetical protein
MTINLNNKDFFYEEISKSIADQIIHLMSRGIDQFLEYEVWEYDIDIADCEYEKPIIKWVFNVSRVPHDVFAVSGRDYDVVATAGYDECGELSIYLTVLLKKGAWIKKAKLDYAEIVGVVAHEIHHITQNEKPILTAQYDGDDDHPDMQYFLEPSEVEAFQIGFRAQCSISGEDMRTAMLSYLAYRELNQNQLNEIVETWLNVEFA